MARRNPEALALEDVRENGAYSTAEAAMILGLAKAVVRRMCREGQMAHFRPTRGQIRIRGKEIIRCANQIEYEGRVPRSYHAPIESEIEEIEVGEEQAAKILPKQAPAPVEKEKSFWDRVGFPMLLEDDC